MLLVGIALVGLAAGIASYISYRMESGRVCIANEGPGGCKMLYMIPQAWFMNVVHFSVLAPFYFLALLVISIADALTEVSLELAIWILYLIGLLFVPYLVYLEIKIARVICIWCTIMHACIILGFILSTVHIL